MTLTFYYSEFHLLKCMGLWSCTNTKSKYVFYYTLQWKLGLKGIVHPKMNLFTQYIYLPSSSSKPVSISLFCWTQRKIFWRKFVTRLFWGTIDFHSRKKILWKSMEPQNCSVSHILQNIFLCVQQNKDIHIEIYTQSESKLSFDIWFVRVGQDLVNIHLFEYLQFEGVKKSKQKISFKVVQISP